MLADRGGQARAVDRFGQKLGGAERDGPLRVERDRGFADSLLEQAGFELTVPLATDPCGAANPGRSFSSIWTLMMI
jgi:hypothetical protein